MANKYLVVEDYYEYNDEYYSGTEGDAYIIRSKLFDSQEEAKEAANKLNKELDGDKDFVNYDNETIKPYRVIPVEG